MKTTLACVLLMATALIYSGCNNNVEPTLPLDTNELRATVSTLGTFDSKQATAPSGSAGGATFDIKAPIQGESGEDTLVITLIIPKQNQTPYTVTTDNSSDMQIDYCVMQHSGTCVNYDAKHSIGGTGAITVNSIASDANGTTVQGTFSGTLVPSGFSASNISISNGEFKVYILN